MIVYKNGIDVIAMLKQAGFNTNRIRKEHRISEASLQQIRNGEMVGMKTLDALCEMLDCQPCELIEYVKADGK